MAGFKWSLKLWIHFYATDIRVAFMKLTIEKNGVAQLSLFYFFNTSGVTCIAKSISNKTSVPKHFYFSHCTWLFMARMEKLCILLVVLTFFFASSFNINSKDVEVSFLFFLQIHTFR